MFDPAKAEWNLHAALRLGSRGGFNHYDIYDWHTPVSQYRAQQLRTDGIEVFDFFEDQSREDITRKLVEAAAENFLIKENELFTLALYVGVKLGRILSSAITIHEWRIALLSEHELAVEYLLDNGRKYNQRFRPQHLYYMLYAKQDRFVEMAAGIARAVVDEKIKTTDHTFKPQ